MYIPQLRRNNRQENKRKKNEKRKEQLNNFILSSNVTQVNIPNNKKRYTKKLKLYNITL